MLMERVLCSRCRGQINNRAYKNRPPALGTYSYVSFDPGYRQNAKFHISVIKVRIAFEAKELTFREPETRVAARVKPPIVNDGGGFSFAPCAATSALNHPRNETLGKKGILIVARNVGGNLLR